MSSATLQKSIRYAGDLKSAPVKSVNLEFTSPVYEYVRSETESGDGDEKIPPVDRKVVGTETVILPEPINSKDYQVALPEDFIVGRDKASALFGRYVSRAVSERNLDDLAVTVDVAYLAESGYEVGEEALELIFFPKLPNRADPADTADAADPFKRLLLVNKAAYLRLLAQLTTAGVTIDEVRLLAVIGALADVKGKQPGLLKKLTPEMKQRILAIMGDGATEHENKALDIIRKNFDALFDFPLTIPEIKTLSIGGTFTLVTSDDSPVSTKDLLYYELSAEYPVRGTANSDIRHYEFGHKVRMHENSVRFSFTDDQPIYQASVAGNITVKVKDLGGSIIWTKEFKPGDPHLASIEIKVPLRRPNAMTPADKGAVPDQTKKLRGQVIELSKKCPLNDVTVLVQAKKEGDKVWRIVGASTTDSSGNFAMPYPFGVYTEAAAIVSLTPDSPAAIRITEVKDGNQTIADDFLYLLVRDVDCAPTEPKEECACEGGKKPSRLPDYADLIGSAEYSQDIGAACVNLSTPNRTLSEFSYQAVVRTSDPDVANYTLRKIEAPTADVSAVLNALTAAKSAANAGVEVLTALNGTLNAGLSPLNAPSNAASNAVLAALNALLSPWNAALEPLSTAPGPALSAALGSLNDALSAAEAFNGTLTSALDPLNAAVSASAEASNAALNAALSSAPNPGNFLNGLFNPLNLGSTASNPSPADIWNILFNPLNAALSSASSAANAAANAAARDRLNLKLGDSSVALNAALAAGNAALKAALDAASAVARVNVQIRYDLTGGTEKKSRKPVDLDNPVAWQDAPDYNETNKKTNLSFYQAVSIATGHILHYKALFKADGYSLGELIYSLALAPGQKKEIVVLDSSHTLVGAESQTISQGERLAAGLISERDITNQLGGSISEAVRGASSATTSGISAGLGVGALIGPVGAVLGVSGGVSNSNSSASQNSSRDVSQFFGEKLRQSIMQNAEGYRQLNASVVTTVQEGQRYGVTSEVVANHNHCHALTMMYFEVLRHYAIFQELSQVEECVFVPLLMTNFSTENIYKWRDVLAAALLAMPSETYLQPFSFLGGSGRLHPLLKAFDANERIKTDYANVDFPQGAYDDEPIRYLKGDMLLRVELQRPKTRYDRIKSLPVTTKTVTTKEIDPIATAKRAVTDSILAGATLGLSVLFSGPPGSNIEYNTIETQVQVKQAIFDAFMRLDANYETVPPAQCIRVTNFDPKTISFGGVTVPVSGLDFFHDDLIDRKLWSAYATILGYVDDSQGPGVLKMLNNYFKDQLIAEWDDIFYNDIAPIIFDTIVSSIKIQDIATDFTSQGRYKGGERLMRLDLRGTTSLKRNQLPQELKLYVSSAPALALKDLVTLTIENTRLAYSTSHYNGMLFSGNVNDDLLDGTVLDIPETSEDKRNPRKEDQYLVYKLIEHLNSNLEYYNKVLWYNLDPDRRYMLLDGFSIQVLNDSGLPFDDTGLPLAPRSLASVVKNDLITVAGNSLVFPVAEGYRVSKSYIVPDSNGRRNGRDEARKVTLLDHYQPLTPVQPYRISVPTKGVFAEAVQGACNACEKIETERIQDWSRFSNIDEPTAIAPVTTPVPTVTDWRATFKELAPPIVNIQGAPVLPAPGVGLAGLSDLLGKAGVFKDITGLDANQQNVLQTYLSNQENAKAFASMAKEMAMQSHNTQNTGKIMDSLKSAKDGGALSQDDYGKLVKDHLQQQIDGGQTKQAELEAAKQAATPSLTKATVDTLKQGDFSTLKAEKTDSEGTESVEVNTKVAGDRIENTDRFIQSNPEFYRDLVMAIANFGTQDRMDGQNVNFQIRGVEGERGQLRAELLAWKENANQIVLSSEDAIVGAIIAAVHQEVFATLPGPTFTQEVAAELVNKAIERALERLLGHNLGDALGFVAAIAKLKMFEAWREHDMAAREEKFVRTMRDASTEIQGKLQSGFYNLDTLLTYYLEWLRNAKPEDFVRFRIPFSPEPVSLAELTQSIRSELRDALSATPGSQQSGLDLVGLFAFLQRNGIIADSPDIERALNGNVGLGVVRNSANFPASHFKPHLGSGQTGKRVQFYVIPPARSRGNVRPEDVAGLGIDPGIIIYMELTGQRALYNLRTSAWV